MEGGEMFVKLLTVLTLYHFKDLVQQKTGLI